VSDPSNYVGTKELLLWLNTLLQLNVTKVGEELGSGAIYIQVFDAIYFDPDTQLSGVPLRKVRFHAKLEHEFVQNFKVLQGVFDAHSIQKVIPVTPLTQGKHLDNLQFLQWVYMYFQKTSNHNIGSYDPVQRRTLCRREGPPPKWLATAANSEGTVPPRQQQQRQHPQQQQQAPPQYQNQNHQQPQQYRQNPKEKVTPRPRTPVRNLFQGGSDGGPPGSENGSPPPPLSLPPFLPSLPLPSPPPLLPFVVTVPLPPPSLQIRRCRSR
jgi:RP/EB family microtubule-associated protein